MKASALVATLMVELHQTEQSAHNHPRVEAARLGEASPAADAMRAVSHHAAEVLREVETMTTQRGIPYGGVGRAIGRAFSYVRRWWADHFIDTERNYRGTLLGIRHGMDLVRYLREVAIVEHDEELADWCSRWLLRRTLLTDEVERQLAWLARHPMIARSSA